MKIHKRYDYMVVDLPLPGQVEPQYSKRLQKWLTEQGSQGWVLVGLQGMVAIFCRPQEEK